MKLQSIFFILLIFNFQLSFSQKKFKRFSNVDGFIMAPISGVGSMAGELGNILHFKPVYGFSLEKGVSEKLNLNIEILGGVMNGSNDEIYNEKFQSDYFQIQLCPSLNLSRLYFDKVKRFELKAYLGIGLIWFHTNVYDLNSGAFLRSTSDGTTKHTSLFQQVGIGVGDAGIYYTRELIVPIGISANYNISEKFILNSNFGYNYIYNDKFDGTTPYNLVNPYIIGGENSYSNTANDGWLRFSVGLKYMISSFSFENQRGV